MKVIGMLGGMSWQSTVSYYKAINEGVGDALGGLHSAKICLYSVDFDEIEKLQQLGNWYEAGDILAAAATSLEAAGAEGILICANTMHKVASRIESAITIPLLHIADATAKTLVADGINRVGLIGTQFTMEQDFYKSRLREKFALDVIVPPPDQQKRVHRVIYSELCLGKIVEESKHDYLKIIDDLKNKGAEAVILGCTEIALLVRQEDTPVPLYDTTEIHAAEAVRFSIES